MLTLIAGWISAQLENGHRHFAIYLQSRTADIAKCVYVVLNVIEKCYGKILFRKDPVFRFAVHCLFLCPVLYLKCSLFLKESIYSIVLYLI